MLRSAPISFQAASSSALRSHARAVQQPDIILADEPIASLDPRNTKIVMDALLRINKHFGITVFCNLHSLELARGYCDRLIGMSAGRVVFDGEPAALTDHIARELYDLEANEVMGSAPAAAPDGSAVPALVALPLERSAAVASLQSVGSNIALKHNREIIMINRRTVLASAASLAFVRTVSAAEDWRAKYPEITFAVIPAENGSGVTERYTPFVNYLSKELGIKVTLRVANDYAAVIEGQRAGNIQIGYYGPASFARARVTGVKTDAFVIDVNSDGSKGYYSVFYVLAKSPYQKLEDLKGKNLGLVDPNSTSGNNMPRFKMNQMGYRSR